MCVACPCARVCDAMFNVCIYVLPLSHTSLSYRSTLPPDFERNLRVALLQKVSPGDVQSYTYSNLKTWKNSSYSGKQSLWSSKLQCGACNATVKASPSSQLARNFVRHIQSRKCSYTFTSRSDGGRLSSYFTIMPNQGLPDKLSARSSCYHYNGNAWAKKSGSSGFIPEDPNDHTWTYLQAPDRCQVHAVVVVVVVV